MPINSSEMNQKTDSIPNTVRLPFEIIDHILSFASRSALFNCLFTCKAYSDFAKSHLWRHLDTAIPLLDLLGPTTCTGLVQRPQVTWNFNQTPLASQWETFAQYAQLVKTIAPTCVSTRFASDTSCPLGTTDRIWSQDERRLYLASQKERYWGRLNPSISVGALQILHTIPIEFAGDQITRSIVSLTPSLERLDFVFAGVKETDPCAFAPFLGQNLRSLSLWFQEKRTNVPECVLGSLRVLRKALSSPQSSIKSLQTLEIRMIKPTMSAVRSSDVDTAFLELLDHCSTLRKLHYGPRLSRHHVFLSKIQTHLPNLVSLSVCINDVNTLNSFASGLALVCPEIEELNLSHGGSSPTSFSSLISLLSLRNLRKLSFVRVVHPAFEWSSRRFPDRPWLLKPDLLVQLSAAWPNLRCLTLEPSEHVDIKSLESFGDENLFGELEELTMKLRTECWLYDGVPFPQVDLGAIRPLRSLKTVTIRTPNVHGTPHTARWAECVRCLGTNGMKIFHNGNYIG